MSKLSNAMSDVQRDGRRPDLSVRDGEPGTSRVQEVRVLAVLSSAARRRRLADAEILERAYLIAHDRYIEQGGDEGVFVDLAAADGISEVHVLRGALPLYRQELLATADQLRTLAAQESALARVGAQRQIELVRAAITKRRRRLESFAGRLTDCKRQLRALEPGLEPDGDGRPTVCARPGCGVWFVPERRPRGSAHRKYHSNACRQRDYRDRAH
jgi:hypothetical protein